LTIKEPIMHIRDGDRTGVIAPGGNIGIETASA